MNIQSPEGMIPYVTQTLSDHLSAGDRVVWLIPGGSGIRTATEIMNSLSESDVDLSRLRITMTDERYGALAHADENWQQLLDGGINFGDADTYRVVQADASLDATVDAYADILRTWLTTADYALAMFGIGPDGHVAGIKPHSPSVSSTAWAAGYEWEDFTRMTATAVAIDTLDEAVVYAVGAEKHPTLDALVHEDISLDEQPAQVLKRIPKCTLFTDYQTTTTKEN